MLFEDDVSFALKFTAIMAAEVDKEAVSVVSQNRVGTNTALTLYYLSYSAV